MLNIASWSCHVILLHNVSRSKADITSKLFIHFLAFLLHFATAGMHKQ